MCWGARHVRKKPELLCRDRARSDLPQSHRQMVTACPINSHPATMPMRARQSATATKAGLPQFPMARLGECWQGARAHHTIWRPSRSRSSSRSSMSASASKSAAKEPLTNATKRATWLQGLGVHTRFGAALGDCGGRNKGMSLDRARSIESSAGPAGPGALHGRWRQEKCSKDSMLELDRSPSPWL